ncbi:hypothetical protein BV898_13427 [Hypsibius exemplaris]|uniref:Uncharacterized protein n=1 Tax=Hypsibius exemplaris TaxID=2072580 RepID=A0A1W0WAR6_HYPEX|nr:hypothetical protein BV898_13427 [Hypsibius exemplaris]
MTSLSLQTLLVCLGLVVCVHGHFGGDSQSNEVGDDSAANLNFRLIQLGFFGEGGENAGRPKPRPRLPPFFVGAYRSVPSRDWQINMFQIYNATGFPTDYVNAVMVINITDLRNGSFRFVESADNTTFYDLVFKLDQPIVVNGTNSSSDGQYMFMAARSKLTVWSNSTALGLSRADMQFDPRGRCNGVDVVYRIMDPKITGARHFRRVRRKPRQDEDESVEPMEENNDQSHSSPLMQDDSGNQEDDDEGDDE